MNELISIIVPVYNVEEYLNCCIQSILQQTYQEYELILVDDGSTDASGSICDAYAKKDERIRVIHKGNGGVSSARNAGLKAARGKYVGFVDADDWIDDHMYQTLYNVLLANDADLSTCEYFMEDNGRYYYEVRNLYDIEGYMANCRAECRRIAESDICNCNNGEKEKVVDKERGLDILFASFTNNYLWNKLYRRELFDGLRFPDGRCYEDVSIMHHIFARARRTVFVERRLYYYRRRSDSIVHNKTLMMAMGHLEAMEERCNSHEYNGREQLMVNNVIRVAKQVKEVLYSTEIAGTEKKELEKRVNDFMRLRLRNCKLSVDSGLKVFFLIKWPVFWLSLTKWKDMNIQKGMQREGL